MDCSNYTDVLVKINSGNGSDYSSDLEMIWNSTSGQEKTGMAGSDITARDVFLECLRADFR